jgi:hypothetical protein
MTRIRRISLVVAATAIGAIGLSCGDGGGGTEPPTPGIATVSLVTPNTDDGAVIVTLQGQGLGAVTSASASFAVFTRQVSSSEIRVLVAGNLSAAPLFSVAIGAINKLGSYTATVDEVANRSDQIRSSTSGYSLRLTNASP